MRTYAATGDAKWEQENNEILAIRAGKKPRPLNHDRIYWDFRAADEPMPPRAGDTAMLVLFALAMHLMLRHITQGLDAVAHRATSIAEGDFSADFAAAHTTASGKDEISQLMAAVRTMNDALVRVVA